MVIKVILMIRVSLHEIHSKLLICDDTTVIIGSANINDRSLLGSRDSEVCALFDCSRGAHKGEHTFKSALGGGSKLTRVGHFARPLRENVFHEHLGTRSVNDPSTREGWGEICMCRGWGSANPHFRLIPTSTR